MYQLWAVITYRRCRTSHCLIASGSRHRQMRRRYLQHNRKIRFLSERFTAVAAAYVLSERAAVSYNLLISRCVRLVCISSRRYSCHQLANGHRWMTLTRCTSSETWNTAHLNGHVNYCKTWSRFIDVSLTWPVRGQDISLTSIDKCIHMASCQLKLVCRRNVN